jgi:hypothetical protein
LQIYASHIQKINNILTVLKKTEEIRAKKQYLEYEKNAKSQKLTKRELPNSQK